MSEERRIWSLKAINVSSLTNSLDTGSTKRLENYSRFLSRDNDEVLCDRTVERLLLNYARPTFNARKVSNYLKTLKDKDGYPFSQSLRQYKQVVSQAKRFAEKQVPSFRWNKNYQKALEYVFNIILSTHSLNSLVYLSDSDIKEALQKTDTHSGWNYILTGSKKKGENICGVLENYQREEAVAIQNRSFNKPILIGTRTQCSGAFEDESGGFTGVCKHKTRLVSMIDMYQIIAECKFAVPIQEQMSYCRAYAGGKDNREISNILLNYRRKYQYSLTIDYSSYDQTLPSWLIEDVFEKLKLRFRSLTRMDDQLFDVVVRDFIEKNFVLSDEIVHSEKGVPSGSRFTQIIGSICNWVIISTYMLSKGYKFDMMVMGDDNIIFTHIKLDPNDLASYLLHNFGVIVNPDKMSGCETSDDPWFLSRQWTKGGEWRHPNVLYSKLKYPERWRDYTSSKSVLKPELIIYSYILTYSLGMYQLMDVKRFLADYSLTPRDLPEEVLNQMAYVDRAFRFY